MAPVDGTEIAWNQDPIRGTPYSSISSSDNASPKTLHASWFIECKEDPRKLSREEYIVLVRRLLPAFPLLKKARSKAKYIDINNHPTRDRYEEHQADIRDFTGGGRFRF